MSTMALIDVLHPGPAFDLHHFRSALLDHPAGVPPRLLDALLVRHERHVDHNQSSFCRPHDGFCMVDHLIDGHGKGIRIAEHYVAQGIAHEDNVDTCLINDSAKDEVVRRQHGDLLTAFALPDRGYR